MLSRTDGPSAPSKLDRLEQTLRDNGQRLAAVEIGQGTIMRQLGSLVEADARLQVGLDRLGDEVERIKRRLDLNDSPAAE